MIANVHTHVTAIPVRLTGTHPQRYRVSAFHQRLELLPYFGDQCRIARSRPEFERCVRSPLLDLGTVAAKSLVDATQLPVFRQISAADAQPVTDQAEEMEIRVRQS